MWALPRLPSFCAAGSSQSRRSGAHFLAHGHAIVERKCATHYNYAGGGNGLITVCINGINVDAGKTIGMRLAYTDTGHYLQPRDHGSTGKEWRDWDIATEDSAMHAETQHGGSIVHCACTARNSPCDDQLM